MTLFSLLHIRRLGLILLFLALLPAAVGCSPEARHQVLTVLFTGVPPLGWKEELQRLQAEEAIVVRQDFPSRFDSGGWNHGPYAAGECGSCHEMVPPRNPGERPTRIVVGQFVETREQMCVACHAEKTAERARNDGLWLHGPADNCLRCHHPHLSAQPAMLRRTADELCLSCHDDGLIHSQDLHAGVSDCLSCHNPHLGADALMLSWDYEELF
ncbi:cytochrome c3 family protein [Pelovirga terrestris]|uniref:Doubled CXXCH motif domain-containing protein n=1 Tax=Pelovirga terrestris TaxID=2771352 RepID=A0A8J6UGZ5_9BACT|nr:cytochrome c3 family protein [Pelovirga terrestris]MBD1400678.1 hypothetical protein [Pelovirga terrestris]